MSDLRVEIEQIDSCCYDRHPCPNCDRTNAAKACLLELLDLPEHAGTYDEMRMARKVRAVISRHFPTQEDPK